MPSPFFIYYFFVNYKIPLIIYVSTIITTHYLAMSMQFYFILWEETSFRNKIAENKNKKAYVRNNKQRKKTRSENI